MKKLQGLRVLNTRPAGQNHKLTALIEKAGGMVMEIPALVISPLDNTWLAKLDDLTTFDIAIFISTNAVNFFFAELLVKGVTWPQKIICIPVGFATKKALNRANVNNCILPLQADSSGVVSLDLLKNVAGKKILYIKGKGGRQHIVQNLIDRQAEVLSIAVYEREMPEINNSHLCHLWHDNVVDIIIFTSTSAIKNFINLCAPEGMSWLQKTTCLVISERLAQFAKLQGIDDVIVANYTSILSALEKFNQGKCND